MNAASVPYSFEPLAGHDRSAFACGNAALDTYLRSQASQDAKRKVAAPFVMLDPHRRIVGYYTLSAYGVRVEELPPEISRRLPKYPLMPATLLGRLAVDRAQRGRKLGQLLLMDALYRSWKNTVEIASVGVVAEAIDESARDFYLHHQFIALPGQARKLTIGMETIRKLFA